MLMTVVMDVRLNREFVTVHPKFKYEWMDHTVSKFPYDNPELVQKLIEQGADVNCLDLEGRGYTPLITAVKAHNLREFDLGWDVGCNGSTHVPMPPNKVKVMKLLVEAGADIDHLTTLYNDLTTRTSALLEASGTPCWNVEAIKLFVSSGANVNIRGQDMWSPLLWASRGSGNDPANLEIVELLVSKGAE